MGHAPGWNVDLCCTARFAEPDDHRPQRSRQIIRRVSCDTGRSRCQCTGWHCWRSAQSLVSRGTVAGSLQSEISCPEDWQLACAASHLTFITNTRRWERAYQIPRGLTRVQGGHRQLAEVNYGAGGGAGLQYRPQSRHSHQRHLRLGSGHTHRDPHPEQLNSLACKNAGGFPAFMLLNESLGYAVRIRARAARRFNARRSSSLRPPQTP